jgi:hypothetical protein
MKKMFSTNGSWRPVAPMLVCLLLVADSGELASALGLSPIEGLVPLILIAYLVARVLDRNGMLGWLNDWNIWIYER